jgi:hypothetical protein
VGARAANLPEDSVDLDESRPFERVIQVRHEDCESGGWSLIQSSPEQRPLFAAEEPRQIDVSNV